MGAGGGVVVTRRAYNRLAVSGVDRVVEVFLGRRYRLLSESLRYHQVRSR
jgi:hypothetical protein